MRKPPPTRLIRTSIWVAALLGFSIVASVFRSLVGLKMAPFEVFFHVLIFTLQGYILCFILHVWRTEPNPGLEFFNDLRRRMDEDFRRAREDSMMMNAQLDRTIAEVQEALDEWEPDEEEDWDDDDEDDYEEYDDDDDEDYDDEDYDDDCDDEDWDDDEDW